MSRLLSNEVLNYVEKSELNYVDLQTAFIVFYMMFAPVCGYYGDRYNRKFIMEIGLIIWMIAVLLSTLCGPAVGICVLFRVFLIQRFNHSFAEIFLLWIFLLAFLFVFAMSGYCGYW